MTSIDAETTSFQHEGKNLLKKNELDNSFSKISIHSMVDIDSPLYPRNQTIAEIDIRISEELSDTSKPDIIMHTLCISYYEAIQLRNSLSAIIEYARDYRQLKLYEE